jgi:magnesium chelatase subunit I
MTDSERLKKLQAKILPYALIVGQRPLKDALELAFVEPRIGGVLLSGERGTAKSTAVRAFSIMAFGELPVTLPINATEDRVVGGLRIESLMKQQRELEIGLLKKADSKLLYVDEVNLLDDHIVNLILDAASTGQLTVEREGLSEQDETHFTLVGTMNPEEGHLRPQLLDRFGLMVEVKTEHDNEVRRKILRNVLTFGMGALDEAVSQADLNSNSERSLLLADAKKHAAELELEDAILDLCVNIARAFGAQGHRGEQVMALASRAHAALRLAAPKGEAQVDRTAAVLPADVKAVARFAIQHRRPRALKADDSGWTKSDQELVDAGGEKPSPEKAPPAS